MTIPQKKQSARAPEAAQGQEARGERLQKILAQAGSRGDHHGRPRAGER